MDGDTPLPDLHRALRSARTLARHGRLTEAIGTTLRATGLDVRVGQTCDLVDPANGHRLPAEVIGFSGDAALLTPLKPLQGLGAHAEVIPGPDRATVPAGPGLRGRVIDAHGVPLDGRGPLLGPFESQPVYAEAPGPFERTVIEAIFPTGVKVIDALLTTGVGQRLGIFATAGAGKSVLLGMIGRRRQADVNVIALIGERGREVREFLDQALGPEGLERSVVVVATSDRPPMERVRAANVATAIAEHFRGQGQQVALMMDSVTRYARALRDVGLSMGEPPVRRGYPPSVFAELPRLFERAGAVGRGAITAFYTVLIEDDDGSDPIDEEVRAILDGHVYLSRKLAETGRYPAVDVLASISRLAGRLAPPDVREAAQKVRGHLSRHQDIAFLLQVGDYRPGGDPAADEAIHRMPQIERFLRQAPEESLALESSFAALREVVR
jgi:type III secretion protein N (ATPase)